MSSELLTRHIRERQTMHSRIFAKRTTRSMVSSEGAEDHDDQNRTCADERGRQTHTTEACLGLVTHRVVFRF